MSELDKTEQEKKQMELSDLQNKILNAPDNRIVVLSSAASGKTRLLTEKVRQLLRANVNPREIAVITFTNMAASELRQRLGEDYKEGLFVGTIHALANYMLCSAGIDTKNIIKKEEFDKLFEMVKEAPTCIKHLEWILLDEGQDSDKSQFNFLFEMINPDYFFVCADPKQSIYQWKGSDPRLVQELAARPDVAFYDMNENYRNGANILGFAKRLISPVGMNDTSIAMRRGNGAVTEIPYQLSTIVKRIGEEGEYRDWAILTRTNQEISTISTYLRKKEIPFITFKQGDLSKEELVERMERNVVKILTVHSAKGLEWPNVITVGMRYSPAEERNVCYVAATRAKDNLIWMSYAAKKKNYTRTYQW